MESNHYDLILVAVPSKSNEEIRLYEFVNKYKCLAMGMGIDLENNTTKDLEELMMTIIAEGAEKYGLQAE